MWRRSTWLSEGKADLAPTSYQKSPQTVRFTMFSQKSDLYYFIAQENESCCNGGSRSNGTINNAPLEAVVFTAL